MCVQHISSIWALFGMESLMPCSKQSWSFRVRSEEIGCFSQFVWRQIAGRGWHGFARHCSPGLELRGVDLDTSRFLNSTKTLGDHRRVIMVETVKSCLLAFNFSFETMAQLVGGTSPQVPPKSDPNIHIFHKFYSIPLTSMRALLTQPWRHSSKYCVWFCPKLTDLECMYKFIRQAQRNKEMHQWRRRLIECKKSGMMVVLLVWVRLIYF